MYVGSIKKDRRKIVDAPNVKLHERFSIFFVSLYELNISRFFTHRFLKFQRDDRSDFNLLAIDSVVKVRLISMEAPNKELFLFKTLLIHFVNIIFIRHALNATVNSRYTYIFNKIIL